jgi:DNA-binding FrmR family transcriptional regulator
VQGIRRMVAANEYCMDILTQVAAARSALEQVAIELALNHLQHCVICRDEQAHPKAVQRSEEELLNELRILFKRLYG